MKYHRRPDAAWGRWEGRALWSDCVHRPYIIRIARYLCGSWASCCCCYCHSSSSDFISIKTIVWI